MSDKALLDKTRLNETLSALLDHEAGKTDTLELRRLVRAMEQDPELAACYQRFALGSAVIRGDTFSASADFLHRVQNAIETTPVDSVEQRDTRPGRKAWHKAAGQFAVAASVAVVAVWYVQAGRMTEPSLPASAVVAENKILGANPDNRLLPSRVLTVSAGNVLVNTASAPVTARTADCVVLEQELPADSALYPLQLPDGYVLCRMDDNRQRCHAVSASLACYPR